MTGEDVKQDTTLTINWLRVNAPSLAAIAVAGFVGGNMLTGIQTSIATLSQENAAIRAQLQHMQNIPYRVDQAEAAILAANTRVDNLSNTIINQMDLIRRDVNRLTTEVEVLSSRVGILTGDIDEPKQRRSRPGPAVEPDAP